MTILESAGLARVHEEKCHTEATLRSENFQQNVFFMERILMENIFQHKLAAYRQFPVLIGKFLTSNPIFITRLCMLWRIKEICISLKVFTDDQPFEK